MRRRGITLMELLLAASITAVILIPILGIFGSVTRQWNGRISRSEAIQSANMGADIIANEAKDAMSFSAAGAGPSRPNVFTMPQTDNQGNLLFSIVNGGTSLLFQPGTKVRYYLSDSTGSITASGNILWREYQPLNLGWVTDLTSSLLPGTVPRGRVGNLNSLTFTTDSTPNTVIVNVGSAYTEGGTTSSYVTQRRIYMANHN